MKAGVVAESARLLREHYSPAALDPGVTESTLVENERGHRALVLPRAEQDEPYRSFSLIDAAALGSTLVVTFTWEDDAPDGTVFLLPYDTRGLDLDMRDNIAVTTFVKPPLGVHSGRAGPAGRPRAPPRSPPGSRSYAPGPSTPDRRRSPPRRRGTHKVGSDEVRSRNRLMGGTFL